MSDGRDDTQARPAGGVKPSLGLLQKWSRAPYWEPDEGVALAFGLDPARVIESDISGYGGPYLKARDPAPHFADFAHRAIAKGHLRHHAHPSDFINWAETVGLAFHDDWTSQSQKPIKRTGRRGRKVSYDWTGARVEFDRLMEHHGDLTTEDSVWSSQAHVERAIADWFNKKVRKEPGVSTIRPYVKKWLAQYEADKADN